MENKNAVNQPQKLDKKVRNKLNIHWFINSPWVFLMLPLLIGGFYLVNHPEYVVIAMQYPYALACVLAIAPVYFIVKLIINFFSVIENWIRLQFEKAKGAKRSQFLEFVIAVFMFVSVCEAGPFFNDAQGHILWNSLGYITVFAFDLVAVVCMRSRAKSLRKGNDKKAFVYEIGVWICALVSIYANFHSVSQNLAALTAGKTDWLTALAPLVGVTFPVMIIFLSYATDSDDDVDDPEVFKKEQEKRVLFLVAKREIATRMHEERVTLDVLKEREFFLKSWLFTQKKVAFVVDSVTSRVLAVINKEIATLKTDLQQKEQVISSQVHRIEGLSSEITSLSLRFGEERKALENQSLNIAFQLEQITQIRDEILSLNHDLMASFDRQIDAKIQVNVTDLQQQINQIRAISAVHFVSNKKADLEEKNTPKLEARNTDLATKEIPENYGLQEAEKHALIMAFPALEKWFLEMPVSVSESEITEATNTRLNALRNAVKNHTVKSARGRGNKLQTDSVLLWLLNGLKRSANRARNTGEMTPKIIVLNQENREPNTGEMEAVQ